MHIHYLTLPTQLPIKMSFRVVLHLPSALQWWHGGPQDEAKASLLWAELFTLSACTGTPGPQSQYKPLLWLRPV